MARASLYQDPDTIKLVADLDKRGLSREAIAERMGVSKQTVRKILEPGYAESERKRGQDVDKARAPLRRQDPDYQAYQAKHNDSDAHRARSRAGMAKRRKQEATPEPATWAEAAPIARAERVTAEERRKAEAAVTRSTAALSLDASIAANRLIRATGLAWSDLLDALLIDAAARGWRPPISIRDP